MCSSTILRDIKKDIDNGEQLGEVRPLLCSKAMQMHWRSRNKTRLLTM